MPGGTYFSDSRVYEAAISTHKHALLKKLVRFSPAHLITCSARYEHLHGFALDINRSARNASEHALALLRDIGTGAYPGMADPGGLIPDFF